MLVTAGRDTDARIWEAATGHGIRHLRGHFGPVAAASFSPDGRWVVTAGPITAGLWEVATGRLVFFLRGHTATLTAASFSRDGRRILTADRTGARKSYRCEICGDLEDLVAIAERRLAATGRRLTPSRRARYAR
jgi:WD40 repeat protein